MPRPSRLDNQQNIFLVDLPRMHSAKFFLISNELQPAHQRGQPVRNSEVFGTISAARLPGKPLSWAIDGDFLHSRKRG